MVDHAYREQVTLLLVNDALEANARDIKESLLQLLDAAGTLIMHAHIHNGGNAMADADVAAEYLIDQIASYLEGGQ